MRKFAVALLVAMLLTTSLVGYSEDLSDELSEGIVRLHIIAESDSDEDQAVKLKVRDKILEEMNRFDTKEEVRENLGFFEEVANRVLKEEGFDYTARAEFGTFMFPTKHYDNFSLPKGEYEAVRINLGKAQGKNWWCVLFPPLCMVDEAKGEEEALLKETFGENYDIVKNEGKIPVKIKFKLAELF